MTPFNELGAALHHGGRVPLRLPTVEFMTADLAGQAAALVAVAGADVLPWGPARGVYLVIERGDAPAGALAGVAGVCGALAPAPYGTDARGLQITYCYLDDDPVATAALLGDEMRRRWASGDVVGLLAALFYTPAPFDWTRHLPGGDVTGPRRHGRMSPWR